MLKKLDWKLLLGDIFWIFLGSICYGVAISMFSAPNHIAPGGVTGIATLLNYVSIEYQFPFEIPIGVATIAMNIPLLWAAWTVLGRRMAIRTVMGIAMSSVMVDVLDPYLSHLYVVTNTENPADPLLVCIFGGAILGLAVGLIMRRGGTTGGSEVMARLLEKKYPHMSVGNLILGVDAVVIAISAVVYGRLENAMYAVVFVFIGSQIIDRVVYGGRQGKIAMILSQKDDEVRTAIIERVDRGVTLLKAQGGYTGQDQKMILCAVRPDEVFRLRKTVFEVDPNAFFMMLTTDEVRGNRWMNPHEQ